MNATPSGSRVFAGLDIDTVRPLRVDTGDGLPHRLYRSRSQTFWLIPAGREGRVAAASLYSPQSAGGRALRLAMRIGRWPGQRVALDEDAVRSLASRIGEPLGLSAVTLGFTVGPPRPANKFVVAVIGPELTPVAFAKVAPSPESRRRLITEEQVLTELAGHPELAWRVPRVIDHFSWQGTDVLLLTAGPVVPGPSQAGTSHLQFLRALQDATRQATDFAGSATGRMLETAAAARSLTPEERARYRRVADRLRAALGDATLPTALSHGDFIPTNTRLDGDDLWVFDWESARGGDLPLNDVFHFNFALAALKGTREPDAWNADAVRLLWPEAADVLPELRLAYLSDVSWEYARHLGAPNRSRQNPILARAWSEIDRALAEMSG